MKPINTFFANHANQQKQRDVPLSYKRSNRFEDETLSRRAFNYHFHRPVRVGARHNALAADRTTDADYSLSLDAVINIIQHHATTFFSFIKISIARITVSISIPRSAAMSSA